MASGRYSSRQLVGGWRDGIHITVVVENGNKIYSLRAERPEEPLPITPQESVENLERQVIHLLDLCLPKLSLQDVTEVRKFVEHNELGLAADTLLYIIETLGLAKNDPRIEPLALELAESLRKAEE